MNGGMLTENLNLCICLTQSELNTLLRILRNIIKLKKTKLISFQGLNILDIGCGGGLISEPMSRLGASVTGIDAAEKNIHIAKLHSKKIILK